LQLESHRDLVEGQQQSFGLDIKQEHGLAFGLERRVLLFLGRYRVKDQVLEDMGQGLVLLELFG